MRRSHRLALSALGVLVALVVAGRLATTSAARQDRSRRATATARADGDASEAIARTAQRIARSGRAASEVSAPGASAANGGVRGGRRDGDPVRDAEARSGSSAPIALDDPQVALGAALAVAGRDAGAPRAIEIWRIVGERAARVAVGASRADGSLDLPPLVLPAGEVTLVASPRGEGAASPNASAPVAVSRDPSAPRLVAFAAGGDESELVVTLEPAEEAGSIVVARATEEEIGRAAVAAVADAAPVSLVITVALGADDGEILIAQEVPDGRRSPWRRVAIARQPQGD